MNEVMNLKRLCTGVRAQQDGSTTYWYQTPLQKPLAALRGEAEWEPKEGEVYSDVKNIGSQSLRAYIVTKTFLKSHVSRRKPKTIY